MNSTPDSESRGPEEPRTNDERGGFKVRLQGVVFVLVSAALLFLVGIVDGARAYGRAAALAITAVGLVGIGLTLRPRRKIFHWSVVLMSAGVVVAGYIFFKTRQTVVRSSQAKVLVDWVFKLGVAEDQFILEHPHRIFTNFDEIYGRNGILHYLENIAGEDLSAPFPHRRDAPFVVVTADGRRFEYYSGFEDPKPQPDGVVVARLSDGRRFETTWRGGARDGPFRAYYADGKLWGEATYAKNRVVGPAWLYTRDGKKFDELKDGEAAERALEGK